MIRLVDSHCHLQSSELETDRDAVLSRAEVAGVDAMVLPATDAASCRRALALARAGCPVAVAVGIHPGSIQRVAPDDWKQVRDLASSPEVVAIGETGLDYYRGADYAPQQRAMFARHLELAAELRLPVIVHNRQADEDVLAALRDFPGTTILHCFVGNRDLAERALELDCYLGFGGPITFRSNDTVRETAAAVPLDRLLVETDAPYLAPHPYRGKRNEPAYVRRVAQRLAEVRGTSLERIAEATTANATHVFGPRLFSAGHSARSAA